MNDAVRSLLPRAMREIDIRITICYTGLGVKTLLQIGT